jgi:outer membrane protein OmpA-like peptidoglycan-associated protein
MRPFFLLFCLICLHILAGNLGAEIFRFKYSDGDRYRIVTEVYENVYVDGRFYNSAEILNRITVEVVEVSDGSGLLEGIFQVSERAWGESGPYRLNDETFHSRFWRDERGLYRIDPQYLMPIIRNIPVFPEESLDVEATWSAQAEEVHDLRVYGIEQPLRIPLNVQYAFVGRDRREGRELAVFEIAYSASQNLRSAAQTSMLMPLKIKGDSVQTYYWDVEAGRPFEYQDRFDYVYLLSDGRFIEFEGTSRGKVIQASEMDREEMAADIQKEIDEAGIEDTVVEPDEKGITITLENINFPPDSAFLRQAEREKLDKIAAILKKYPERDLLIVGHTALAGTAAGRKKLSEERAKVVGEYLLSRGVRQEDQILYMGMGATQPVADNSTEAGMQKNRRVEIKLLEN